MGAKYVGDVCHVSGTYEKDGEQKKRYVKCGAYFENDHGGLGIKLEYVPTQVGEKGLWLSLFLKDKDGNAGSQSKPEKKAPPPDEVPF